MAKIRGFEVVSDWARKHNHPDSDVILPTRSTSYSAGYDFISPADYVIPAYGYEIIYTDIKAYMQKDEYLKIVMRSSLGIKKGLFLMNQIGTIDCDFYNNKSNDGGIMIAMGNRTSYEIEIKKGEKIAQGIFSKYLIADGDNANNTRTGGVGSTNY